MADSRHRRWLTGYIVLALATAGVYYTSTKSANDSRRAIVTSGKIVAVDGCNRDFDTITKVRAVFARALVSLKQQREADSITVQQYETGRLFYQTQLDSFPLPDCRKVAAIITDNPHRTKYPPPFPRYIKPSSGS